MCVSERCGAVAWRRPCLRVGAHLTTSQHQTHQAAAVLLATGAAVPPEALAAGAPAPLSPPQRPPLPAAPLFPPPSPNGADARAPAAAPYTQLPHTHAQPAAPPLREPQELALTAVDDTAGPDRHFIVKILEIGVWNILAFLGVQRLVRGALDASPVTLVKVSKRASVGCGCGHCIHSCVLVGASAVRLLLSFARLCPPRFQRHFFNIPLTLPLTTTTQRCASRCARRSTAPACARASAARATSARPAPRASGLRSRRRSRRSASARAAWPMLMWAPSSSSRSRRRCRRLGAAARRSGAGAEGGRGMGRGVELILL